MAKSKWKVLKKLITTHTLLKMENKNCVCCGAYTRVCPQNCIGKEEFYKIIQENCIHCENCQEVCNFNAVIRR